jgi:hypothetical protein
LIRAPYTPTHTPTTTRYPQKSGRSEGAKRSSSLVECARLAQVLVMPVQAEVSWGGALRLEESGNLFTSITADVTSKCIKLRTNKVRDGTSRGKFLRPVPCTHLVSEGVFECTPRNPLQQPILLWHSSDERGFRVSPLAVLNHAHLY